MNNTDRDKRFMMGGTTTTINNSNQQRAFFEQLMTSASEQERQLHILQHYQKLTERQARRLKHSQDPKHAFSQCIAHRHDQHNRYCDIIPYDATRVILNQPTCGPTTGTGDYINASWISFLPNNKKRYIATQGPLPSTCGDFWRMILEQDVKVIVCLTPEIEQGRIKCATYWPEQDDQVAQFDLLSDDDGGSRQRRTSFGHHFLYSGNSKKKAASAGSHSTTTNAWKIQVKYTRPSYVDQDAACIIRPLQVTCYRTTTITPDGIDNTTQQQQQMTKTATAYQLHYLGWADHGVPQQPHTLNALVQLANRFQSLSSSVRDNNSNNSSTSPPTPPPMVVHCSAGCGRTGTFCVVDTALAWYNGEDDDGGHTGQRQQQATQMTTDMAMVDPIYQITDVFRQQRTTMVQTPAQYLFCYRAIWDQLQKQQRQRTNPHGHG